MPLASDVLKIAHSQLLDVAAGLRGVEPAQVDPKLKNSPAKPIKDLKKVVSKSRISLNGVHHAALLQMAGEKQPKTISNVGGDEGSSNAVYEIDADELYSIVTSYKPVT